MDSEITMYKTTFIPVYSVFATARGGIANAATWESNFVLAKLFCTFAC